MELSLSRSKERFFLFDNLKAILIVLVVFGHMINVLFKFQQIESETASLLWRFIYLFHMPCFVFVSGYFSKKDPSVISLVKNLMLPYVVFNTLFYVMHRNLTFPILPDSAMWYLFSLCIWRVLLPYLKQVKHILCISIVVAILYDLVSVPNLDNSIGHIIRFMPFFLAGYFTTEEHVLKLRMPKGRCIIGCVLVLLTLCFIAVHFLGVIYTDDMIYAKTERIAYDVSGLEKWLMRLFSGVFGFAITLSLISFIPNKKMAISSLGKHTLTIYLFHYLPIIQVIIRKIPIPHIPWVLLIEALVATVILCYLFSRKIITNSFKKFFDWVANILLNQIEKEK